MTLTKIRISYLCLLVAFTSLVACKKNSSSPTRTTTTVPGPTVYVLGSSGDSVAYWKDSIPTFLPITQPAYQLTGMAVSGNTVYVAAGLAGSRPTGEYFTNGVSTVLKDTTGNTSESQVNAIFVNGTDVYVGGSIVYSGASTVPWTGATGNYPAGGVVACYWKNGVPMNLPDIPFNEASNGFGSAMHSDYVEGLFVSGTDVYVAGGSYQHTVGVPSTYQFACYWKNNQCINLCNGLLDSSGYNMTSYPNTTGIWVDGSDVYVSGFEITPTYGRALYWKNGVPTYLATTNSTADVTANSIYVNGGDVYVTGWVDSANVRMAVYWKNGVETTLSHSPTNSVANAIVVSNGDIYVAGGENNFAAWWKNGVVTHLGSGGVALSIAVE